ncbi:MAG: Glycosyl transferase group 1 [Candidatus Moranbacteria bacterium GW2011_GWF2_36_839]|nr:MAG: Glycosyl transferase group 1 [Candidatus Moranbacteria bacterium GW2011_GWF1_36_78]KKQ17688.1 MAG: Glycosyl transferase group 1 [Candidatus Moranbacteria bacterium GW2011_GWF2_36_839]HAT73390.1 glycosyltransferase [Candidatus Moranbacteria bacterium]HBY10753.1 glycosyltransferase [Candidatus Moranbacteria bacterium]
MKLLIFCPYYPPHTGGLESHADEFNKYLSQRGIDITVFTPKLPKNSPESEILYNNVKIIRFPAFEIISNYPLPKFWSLKFWSLFLRLFNQKFDITISRTRFFNTSLLTLIYAKIKKVRWIHIEHGSDFVKLSSNFKTAIAKSYDYTFGFLIFRFSDLNISISKAVQKFVFKFDKRESPIIYRGLDFEAIEKIIPDLETKKEFENKIIISFIGRLYKWKGVENSIEAIKLLPKDLKEKIVFLIIGDGEDFQYLEKISKKESCVKMFGNLPREKVISILKISDIYLHSSMPGGGLSTSLLEAMACGCAIIATPNEGADEVIQDNQNGLLIEKSEKELVAKKITELILDKEKIKRYKKNNKIKLNINFGWENSIEKYLEILKND